MSFDRYTIEKIKESWGGLLGSGSGGLLKVAELCNGSRTSRMISIGCGILIILLIIGLAALLKPGVPASTAQQLTLTATDGQGNRWTMDYLKGQDIQAILSGDTKPGQPLTVKVKFQRKSQTILLMKPEVTGDAGEQYFPGTVKNGQWQDPPKLVIADRNGQVIHRGQFEYG